MYYISGFQKSNMGAQGSVSVPSGGFWGVPVSLPCPSFRGYLHSLACVPCSDFKASSVSFSLLFEPLVFLLNCDFIGPTQTIQNNLSISRSLTQSLVQSLFYHVRSYSQVPAFGAWISLGTCTEPTAETFLFF